MEMESTTTQTTNQRAMDRRNCRQPPAQRVRSIWEVDGGYSGEQDESYESYEFGWSDGYGGHGGYGDHGQWGDLGGSASYHAASPGAATHVPWRSGHLSTVATSSGEQTSSTPKSGQPGNAMIMPVMFRTTILRMTTGLRTEASHRPLRNRGLLGLPLGRPCGFLRSAVDRDVTHADGLQLPLAAQLPPHMPNE